MENEAIIPLEEAKQQLTKLMSRLNKTHREHLLSYAIQEWMTVKIGDDESDEGSYDAEDMDMMDDPVAKLNAIAKEIKNKVPFDAVLPSEKIILPKKGENSDCDPKITLHIDGFLYNDDELDDLVKEGKLKRNYCLDCGSKNIEPLIFISHSTSREDLYHIFNTLLPTLDDKIVLDVGSRLGSVLYGAHVYTDAKRIIGVEMNKELCDLQNEIVRKFKMEKRVEIVNKRIEDAVDIVKSADVVIMNNVFEFYLSEKEQAEIWRFLRANIKKGAYLVSQPDVATSLSTLDTGISVDDWLKSVDETTPSKSTNLFNLEPEDEDEKSSEIACYVVL